MMQKETLNIDCLFLHDTQMADLQKEQTILRKLCSEHRNEKNEPAALPFSVTPPFCPSTGRAEISGKLLIEKPIAVNGWIVRPVTDSQNHTPAAGTDHPAFPVFPGFPPLPQVSGFVLGFAGDAAAGILERYAGAASIADFRVNVWNYGLLTLEFEIDPERAYSCSYTVGPVTWKKSV
jgi:hypothetical protein